MENLVGECLCPFYSLLGSGPEGVNDLCFHTYGEFSPPSSSSPPPHPPPPASRPISQPGGWDIGLQAEIWAWRGGAKEKKKEEEKEKTPICVKA